MREASRRVLGLRPFDVQLIGGMILHDGQIAEMRTGEGKTLVAVLPAYLNALAGRGVHVVTVNDYLARRDSEWVGQVPRFLGAQVGLIQADMAPEARRAAYACDITYVTNSELGFDYLRDNLAGVSERTDGGAGWGGWRRGRGCLSAAVDSCCRVFCRVSAVLLAAQPNPKPRPQNLNPINTPLHPKNPHPNKAPAELVLRADTPFNFCVIDEVDSILIDEARTPLIISGVSDQPSDKYYKAAKIADALSRDVHYTVDEKQRSVLLTEDGCARGGGGGGGG